MNFQAIKNFTDMIRAEAVQQAQYNNVTDEQLHEYIENAVREKSGGLYLTIDEKISVINNVFSSIRGLGILDRILADETITEIMINGHENIFVEQAGHLRKLDEKFPSEEELVNIARKIAGMVGREVNDASPILDARLTDGSRVNIVLSNIALSGTTITIRKFSSEPMTMKKLIGYGSLTPEIANVLKELVEAKYNIFISGGTGSGKTTFLNALSNYIPNDERVITIEDSAELQIVNIPNLVRLEAKNANTAGEGAITIRDLIKSALRMRPERIVVGEVRGAEALDMLQAMNTGHDGSLSTGHANSAADMLSRLETMVITGAEGMPLDAIRQQIASAVDIIVHLSRMRDKTRKTLEICELDGIDEHGRIRINSLFKFVESAESRPDKVIGRLVRTENPMKHTEKLLAAGKDERILNAENFS